jgi:hypothetical protein
MRGLAYKKKKLLFGDGNKLHVGDRYRCRAPWLAVDQSHFTKDIVGGKFGHHSVADLNAHVTALDNEKLVGLLSFAENDTAGSYSPGLDTIASQEAKARIGRHCQLPNTPGDASIITTPAIRLNVFCGSMLKDFFDSIGQTQKNSVRANVFRFALKLGHCPMKSALRICADIRSGDPISALVSALTKR